MGDFPFSICPSQEHLPQWFVPLSSAQRCAMLAWIAGHGLIEKNRLTAFVAEGILIDPARFYGPWRY
jgi:hypothetical protein